MVGELNGGGWYFGGRLEGERENQNCCHYSGAILRHESNLKRNLCLQNGETRQSTVCENRGLKMLKMKVMPFYVEDEQNFQACRFLFFIWQQHEHDD